MRDEYFCNPWDRGKNNYAGPMPIRENHIEFNRSVFCWKQPANNFTLVSLNWEYFWKWNIYVYCVLTINGESVVSENQVLIHVEIQIW